MPQFYRYPASVSSSPSVGVIGDPIPADADLIGFEDPSGDLQPGQVDAAGNILVSQGAASPGRAYVTSVINDYGSTNITTGAWVELVAALPSAVNHIIVFDSSGNIMELGVGAAAAESRVSVITPGGLPPLDLSFASGARVSARAVSANSSTAGTYLIINFYS
jgi:hypothetical protein